MTELIVPVKPLSQVKQRLSTLLTQQQRSQLVLAMLEDLLQTLSSVAEVKVTVVASDDVVFKLAAQWGSQHMKEDLPQGYNAAVRLGLSKVSPDSAVAVLPADIPVATGREISTLVKPSEPGTPMVRLASSRDHCGTNGLFMSNKNLLTPAYGLNSFKGYCRAAQNANLTTEILDLPGLALDIDTADDVFTLCALDSAARSAVFLQSLNLSRGIA